MTVQEKRKKYRREYQREYRKRPEAKEKYREYRRRPEVRARDREYHRNYQRQRRQQLAQKRRPETMLRLKADYEKHIFEEISPALPAAAKHMDTSIEDLRTWAPSAEWTSTNPNMWTFELEKDGTILLFGREEPDTAFKVAEVTFLGESEGPSPPGAA